MSQARSRIVRIKITSVISNYHLLFWHTFFSSFLCLNVDAAILVTSTNWRFMAQEQDQNSYTLISGTYPSFRIPIVCVMVFNSQKKVLKMMLKSSFVLLVYDPKLDDILGEFLNQVQGGLGQGSSKMGMVYPKGGILASITVQ